MRADNEALEGDVEELTAMAGQDERKIQCLSDLLTQHGIDAASYLEQVNFLPKDLPQGDLLCCNLP